MFHDVSYEKFIYNILKSGRYPLSRLQISWSDKPIPAFLTSWKWNYIALSARNHMELMLDLSTLSKQCSCDLTFISFEEKKKRCKESNCTSKLSVNERSCRCGTKRVSSVQSMC